MELEVGQDIIVKIPLGHGHIPPRYREEYGTVTQNLKKCKGFMFLAEGYDTPCFVHNTQILEIPKQT